jgi:hypothetical protein
MNWLTILIRFLFLVKEIVSRQGATHFRRYRLLQTPWLAIYIHQIKRSDMERDMHDHPWSFASIILAGAYEEDSMYPPLFHEMFTKKFYAGDVVEHRADDAHKITLLSSEVWTLVFTSGRERYWGYQTNSGWVGHKEYRQLKNEGR